VRRLEDGAASRAELAARRRGQVMDVVTEDRPIDGEARP
jgi:hypothetical protein